MFRLPVCLFFVAAVVAANPFVETYLSEVSVDSSHQFVELHCEPQDQLVDLSGWQILTSSSACTLSCSLQYGGRLVVDSEALAAESIAHGTFRLNPLEDSLFLLDDTGYVQDRVHYPRYPTGHDSAPLPPAHGSIELWNYDDADGQSMNWYVDSTPTPGFENDDYSRVGGAVSGTGGVTLDEVCLYASGASGHCHRGLYQQNTYVICGLGAGKYEVTARAYHQGHSYQATYPESVAVGYMQAVGGIDVVIPLTGVAESPPADIKPSLRVSGRTLLLSGDGTAPVIAQLYNQVGSRVSTFHLGPINGEKRIQLPTTLAPGIYFANCRFGERTLTTKLVFY